MIKLKTLILTILVFNLLTAQETLSLNLEEATQYAVENNIDAKRAAFEVGKAEKKVWETTATGLPQINANVDYNYYLKQPVQLLPASAFDPLSQLRLLEDYYDLDQFQTEEFPASPDGFVPLTFGTKQTMTAGATLSQLLFSGSYLVGLKSAKAYKQISELQQEKIDEIIKENVANAYAAVLVADENIQIVENNLKVSNKNLHDIEETYKVGLTEEQNVDQIKYTNTTLNTSLNFAKRQREISLNTLKLILGLKQEDELILTSTIDELIATSLVSEDSAEVENLTDFRLADNAVTTSELQVKYQKSLVLPTLSTFLSSSYTGNSDSFTFFNSDQEWFNTTLWGVSLEVPIFSSFQRRAQTQQAQIDLEIAKAELENTEEQLKQNINNALLSYENAVDNYETTKELVALSEKIYGKEQVKFFEGLSSSSDLNSAETQLYQSQNQYIESIFQVVQSKNALYQALGKF